METWSNAQGQIVDLLVCQVNDSFSRLRLVHPPSEAAMEESIKRYGQLLPVVVGKDGDRYEILDGFKRLRACRRLGIQTIKASVLYGSARVLKAAMLEANWRPRTITQIEEAMVLQSLFREDGLTQVEIATLLGRHKSWVCRRIGVVDRLCQEVLNHLRLGLISMSHGRHLSQLPRCNQESALSCILKHHLSCRETEKLVALLMERPRWEHDAILRLPLDILDERTPPRPGRNTVEQDSPFYTSLCKVEQACVALVEQFAGQDPSFLLKQEQQKLSSLLSTLENTFIRVRTFYGTVCS